MNIFSKSMDPLSREYYLKNGINPYLAPLAMYLTQDIFLRGYFHETKILGSENLPHEGPLILAPVHRTRWDALLLPYASGRRITGRDCRFMVTHNEMKGIQGWFLQQFGCFSVDQSQPSLSSLRLAIDLLASHEQLVMFPEGRICRVDKPMKIYNGPIRLALIANRLGIPVRIVPIGIGYAHPFPLPQDKVVICFRAPITITAKGPEIVKKLNRELITEMHSAELLARQEVGRPLQS
uniref:Phospholipid/glycerol acyltransferase domain-containing protein n=1 Tax=Paulinella chromatophora TaxID=39717 RepID=B1X5M0_PAUCH|nr:hypothetical protein PCC_0828 [Paulinella chromatophora]ACB43239.1 hypothetical protein PCC_0828 [Paulinella chromatophora]